MMMGCMKAILKMGADMVRELTLMQMETFIKGSGLMMRNMGMEKCIMRIKIFIWENGKKI